MNLCGHVLRKPDQSRVQPDPGPRPTIRQWQVCSQTSIAVCSPCAPVLCPRAFHTMRNSPTVVGKRLEQFIMNYRRQCQEQTITFNNRWRCPHFADKEIKTLKAGWLVEGHPDNGSESRSSPAPPAASLRGRCSSTELGWEGPCLLKSRGSTSLGTWYLLTASQQTGIYFGLPRNLILNYVL